MNQAVLTIPMRDGWVLQIERQTTRFVLMVIAESDLMVYVTPEYPADVHVSRDGLPGLWVGKTAITLTHAQLDQAEAFLAMVDDANAAGVATA
jgi:hypothetical protein